MKSKTGSILGVMVSAFLVLAFSACDSGSSGGGGGGGGTTPPPAVNRAPEITSTPVITATVGELYGYTVEATDLDGDSLEFGFVDVYPLAMTIDTKSGLIHWLPDVADVGDNTIKVSVSDGTTADYQEFIVTVSLPPNHAPVFTSTPGTTVVAGQVHTYDANATDADADPLIFGLVTSPAGMSIVANTGISSWTPNLGQVGDHIITVSVTDGETTVFQEYTLTVSAPPPNRAPIISSVPDTLAFAGLDYIYNMTATDLDGDTLVYVPDYFPAGMSIDSDSGLISWTPTLGQVGNHWLDISVSDGETSVHQQYAIRVSPTDNGVPFTRACDFTTWWYQDLDGIKGESALLAMHEDGCETVLIVITAYQASTSATTIYTSATKTPTDAGITHITNFAHSLGMKVYFKVHVDIPSGTWRGYITFPTEAEWTAWFASYDALMAHYLDLAEALGVDGFIIGTELKGTEHRESQWRNTIALSRGKFSGLMSYDANWDSYATINWWDALDFIGISAYFPLTASYTPTVPQLVTGWDPWKTDLSALAAVWNMDIVFLELGYQSRNGTNTSPNWAPSGVQDLEEQSDCYEAAFLALFHEPWFKGMGWWMWYWDPTQDVNGFDVYNKPAELDLRWWFAGN